MNDSIPINVGESLRRLREAHNLSMRALAKTSGLSANALSMIERGKTSPSVSTLYKLADALRVPVMAFFGTPQEREQVIYLRALYRSRLPFVRGTWEGLGGEKIVSRVEPFALSLETGADSGPCAHWSNRSERDSLPGRSPSAKCPPPATASCFASASSSASGRRVLTVTGGPSVPGHSACPRSCRSGWIVPKTLP